MAGKATEMSKIKQLLQLHESGVSNRQISKTLGLNKETVNDYVRKFKVGEMQIAELLALDEPVLEGKFIAGTAAYTDKRFEEFKELLPYLEKELARKHVTRHLLWREYLTKHPSGYRYTQFCYHLNQQLVAVNRAPSSPMKRAKNCSLILPATSWNTLTRRQAKSYPSMSLSPVCHSRIIPLLWQLDSRLPKIFFMHYHVV